MPPARAAREGWWRQRLPGSREMPVPASYNDIFADAEVHDHVGDVWYQTVARVPERWRGERIVLRFDAATHRAVVWVDETQVAEHEGGYTPFEADLTDVVEPGAEIRITAVVDNVLSWQSIPPGYVEETPDGPRQRYFHDFFNYAGLHRSVWLYTTPRSYVDDVTVVTDSERHHGHRHATRSRRPGANRVEVRVALRDAEGADVARATGASGELTVEDVHPWRPGEGYLYELAVELRGDGDVPIDVYSASGRHPHRPASDGARFLINDEPFYFSGFGKHEDSAVRGKGHDDAFMVHDFALMEWLGANSFRTSHYPYAEEVLEYADRHGIVVIDETPAVGINSGLAGGVLRRRVVHDLLARRRSTPRRRRRTARRSASLIARDKNHPCVVIWSDRERA